MDKLPSLRKRYLTLVVSFLMIAVLISILPPVKAYASDPEDVTVLAFTSDVHNAENNTAANRQNAWIDHMLEKYGRIDAMGFCGDMATYDTPESQYWAFTQTAMDVVAQKGIEDVYTTGNHEFKDGNYSSTTNSIVDNYVVDGEGLVGDNYVIYCLGTDNFDNDTDNYTIEQVEKLRDYLAQADTDKPIIILTHFPLHVFRASWTTRSTLNADLIVDVLNEASDAGKKIVLLWGHNHTLSDANYDEIYKPGRPIECQAGLTKEIHFYYGAAGCMSDSEYGSGSAFVKGKGLVMTIDDEDQLDFTYYDANDNDVTENKPTDVNQEELGVEPKDGKEYLILSGDGYALTADESGASYTDTSDKTTYTYTGLTGEQYTLGENVDPDRLLWTFTASEDGEGFYIRSRDGRYLNATYTLNDNEGHGVLKLDSTPDVWVVSGTNLRSTNTALTSGSGKYLNHGQASDGTVTFSVRCANSANTAIFHEYKADGTYVKPKWPDLSKANIYRLVDHFTEGREYLISEISSPGNGHALTWNGASANGSGVGSMEVTVKSKDLNEDGIDDLYIEDKNKATNIAWTTSPIVNGFTLTSNNGYLVGKGGSIKTYTSIQYTDRYWNYVNNQLLYIGGSNNYTVYYSNAFTATTNASAAGRRVFIYEKVEEADLHNWDEGVVTTPPTCTEAGAKFCTCIACGETHEFQIPALGHIEVEIPALASTCTEPGLTAGVRCTRCEKILLAQEEIPALGHTEEEIPRVEPTCTKAGNTSGIKCSVCNEILEAPEVIPAYGHTEGELPQIDPTCTQTGLTAGTSCIKCGEIFVAQEVIPALGHAEAEIPAVAATCTQTGLTTGVRCTRCEEILEKQKTTPALGHAEEVIPRVAPTCTQTGLTAGKKCSRCGAILAAQEEIPALGHTWDKEEVTTQPTCTKPRLKILTCTACGATTQKDIPALGHTEEVIPRVAPTCTKTGLTAGTKCSRCGEIMKKQEVLAALGHKEEEIPEVAPTCTQTGLTAGVKCSRCEEILLAQEEIPALGHTEEEIPAVSPTCTEPGHTSGVKCSVCDAILEAPAEIPAFGHNEEEIPREEPTCTKTGLTAGVRCTRCGEILVAQEKISALGHAEVEIPAVAATCTKTGLTVGKMCTRCGVTIKAQQVVAALGHKEAEIPAVAATCTKTGLTAGTECSRCGEILKAQEVVEALGHKEEDIPAVSPTCTQTGLTAGTKCSRCGEILKEQAVIAAFGHKEEEIPAVDPTCTKTGLTAGTKCSRCGETLVAQKVVAALGHVEEEIPAVAATCTKTGFTAGTKCSRCGETLVAQKVVAALGHIREVIPAVAATCTQTGLTAGTKCSRCGEILVEQKVVEALGHTWDQGEVTTQPTCTEPGVKTISCTVCGAKTQEAVEALGHKEEEIPAVDPTCTKTGLTAGTKCSRCEEILVAQKVVAALGHKEVEIPAVAATCTQTGLTAGTKCSRCGEILVAQKVVEALGHTWGQGEVTTQPTCTKPGVKTISCTVCGAKTQEEVEALGHKEEAIPAVDPTCTKTGLTAGTKCSRCEEILVAQKVVAALGHKEEVIPAVAASCTQTGLTAGTKCSRCGEILETQEEIPATGHIWEDDYTIDVEPTETSEGSESIHCSICDEIKPGSSQPVDKLGAAPGGGQTPPTTQPTKPATTPTTTPPTRPTTSPTSSVVPLTGRIGLDGTLVGQGASFDVAEKAILTAGTDEGPAGTKYGSIKLSSTRQTKKSITLKWNTVSGAVSYVIFGNECGRKVKMTKLATVAGKSMTINQIAGKKIKKGKYYKFIVVALDRNNLVVSTSKVAHVSSKGGKVGNYKRVTIKKPVLSKAKKMKKGKKLKLGAKPVKAPGLKVKNHRTICYESSDPSIAEVSRRGVVKAKKAGTCYIFAYTQNGVSKAVKIIVK